MTRWAVYREELVGWVEQPSQIPAYTAAEKQFGKSGRIIRVQVAGVSDSDERVDRETESFARWQAENNDQEQDGS